MHSHVLPDPSDIDLKLVVADMDGTLLDDNGDIPSELWPLLDQMRSRGILFAPASGRQYATLAAMFESASAGMPIIAENGTVVMQDGVELSSSLLDPQMVNSAISTTHQLTDRGHDLGAVVCTKDMAYIERTDARFVQQAEKYYTRLAFVDDLYSVASGVIKFSIFDFDDAESQSVPSFTKFRATHQVVVSGTHWIDMMNKGVNKGTAVSAIQNSLGISPAQTAVFGDYLNDRELYEVADFSFAMANAHPQIKELAHYLAPSNAEHGVITTIQRLMGFVPVSAA